MREAVRKVPVTAACLAAFLLLGLPRPVHMFVILTGGERLSMAYMEVPLRRSISIVLIPGSQNFASMSLSSQMIAWHRWHGVLN